MDKFVDGYWFLKDKMMNFKEKVDGFGLENEIYKDVKNGVFRVREKNRIVKIRLIKGFKVKEI